MSKAGNKNYKFGYNLEVRVRKTLKGYGYHVLRSGQSKGLTDLIAVNEEETLLVQCKRTSNVISIPSLLREDNIRELEKLPVHANARKVIVFTQSGSRFLKVLEWIEPKQQWELSHLTQ